MKLLRSALGFGLLVLSVTVFCQQNGAPWPRFRQDSLNTGVGLYGGSNGLLKWSANLDIGSWIPSSPAIAVDGTIYIGSRDQNLYAFNSNGSLKWIFATNGEIWSSPAIGADGTVYVGSYDDYLYALNTNGESIWRFQTQNLVSAAPAIGSDGTIYVGSWDRNLYAINRDGSEKWVFSTDGVIDSTPAIDARGVLYFGSQDGNLYALNSDGSLKWKYPILNAVTGCSPTVGPDGTVYMGGTGNFYAVSADGSSAGTFPVGDAIWSSPAIAPDGTVYIGCLDKKLYAFTLSDGKLQLKWEYATGNAIYSSAAIGTDGTVYVGSNDGNLYAINPDGSLNWSYQTGNAIGDSPSIGLGGVVYIGSYNGSLYAIGTESNAAPISAITLNPTGVVAGNTSTGTVTLSSAAPAGGDVVTLSNSSSAATVPGLVTVAGGAMTATFTIGTTSVANTTSANITGTSGGASATATLVITPPLAGFAIVPSSVTGGTSAQATITLAAPAPIGGTSVSISNNAAALSVPPSVTIASGQSTATFTVFTFGVAATANATVTASIGLDTETAQLSVTPPLVSDLSLQPAVVNGGSSSTGTVTISGPAPASGFFVALSANSVSATAPPSVTIASGAKAATFMITTVAVASATTVSITATGGGQTATSTLTLNAPSLTGITIAPGAVTGGSSATGTVTVSLPAPSAGLSVGLSAVADGALWPNAVAIAKGQTAGTFTIQTSPVSGNSTITVTASLNGVSQAANLTIDAPVLSSVQLSPATVYSGGSSQGIVGLSGPAGRSGAVVSLSSNKPTAAIPSSATIPGGSTSGVFLITAGIVSAPTTVTVSATYSGTSKSATLTIEPASLMSVTVNPSTVTGGTSASGVVQLNGVAGSGGLKVNLSSDLSEVTVPKSVAVASGQGSATFIAKTAAVAKQQVAKITATAGATSDSTTLTLKPPVPASLTVSPSMVAGPSPSMGAVTLTGPAPSGGVVITLSSTSSAAKPPISLRVGAGATHASFVVATSVVPAATTATVSGSFDGVTVSAVLTIEPPAIRSVTLNPSSVVGGKTSTATVTIGSAAPAGGLEIALSSSNKAASLPTTVTIASGRSSATFKVATSAVTSATSASIAASLGPTSKSATLTIKP